MTSEANEPRNHFENYQYTFDQPNGKVDQELQVSAYQERTHTH